jgi:hypothetical protein
MSLLREKRTLNGNSCSGGFTADGSDPVSGTQIITDSALPAGCYQWKLQATDNVGNVTIFGPSSTVMVDPTAPSAPTFVSIDQVIGSPDIYYSGSGATIDIKPGADNTHSFRLTASSADSETGITTYNFPPIAGFTKSVTGNQATYVAASPTTSDSGAVTATNGAGATSANGFTLTVIVDGTPPASSGFVNPATDTYSTDGTANVSWGAFTDGGSGMVTLTIKRQFATLTANA